MKVFLAGATGAIGRALVPQLVARGHEVVGMTRSASKQDLLRELGARPVVADALDPDAVAQAVASAEPEVIVHELTALSGPMSLREERRPGRFKGAIMTNRLRTEATDHLLAAGRAVGARRFVAQSFGAFRFARTDGPVQTEADPLDPDPRQPGLEAMLYLEQAVTSIEWGEGLALRYGGFYGPGTGISLAPDAVMAAPIRKRRFPIVGDGGGVWSHIQLEDAAAATVLALEHDGAAIYNIVDDEPAPAGVWLPELAKIVGARPPQRFPRLLARLFAGEALVVMATESRGASNARPSASWAGRCATPAGARASQRPTARRDRSRLASRHRSRRRGNAAEPYAGRRPRLQRTRRGAQAPVGAGPAVIMITAMSWTPARPTGKPSSVHQRALTS